MKKIRTILYVVAVTSAIFAGFLSFETTYYWLDRNSGDQVAVAVDSANDGGAAGFAILSGLAIVAASITYLKKEES